MSSGAMRCILEEVCWVVYHTPLSLSYPACSSYLAEPTMQEIPGLYLEQDLCVAGIPKISQELCGIPGTLGDSWDSSDDMGLLQDLRETGGIPKISQSSRESTWDADDPRSYRAHRNLVRFLGSSRRHEES